MERKHTLKFSPRVSSVENTVVVGIRLTMLKGNEVYQWKISTSILLNNFQWVLSFLLLDCTNFQYGQIQNTNHYSVLHRTNSRIEFESIFSCNCYILTFLILLRTYFWLLNFCFLMRRTCVSRNLIDKMSSKHHRCIFLVWNISVLLFW